jgi:hypothetical protein
MGKPRGPRQSVFGYFSVGMFCMFLSQCPPQQAVQLPAAQTPVLETILDVDHNVIAPFGPPGVFQMQPGTRIELRLRLPYPSNVQVGIDSKTLTEVTDTAAHPELDGFFHVQNIVAVDASDPLFFYRVLVNLPQAERVPVNYMLAITDVSQDQTLTGTQKQSTPATFTVFRMPNAIPQPSALLFQDNMIPDQKHPRKVDANNTDHAWIADNVTLAGWLMETPDPGTDNGLEDIHYSIFLDDDFLERNYQATTNGIDTAIMPGRWYTQLDNFFNPKVPLPVTGGQQPNAGMFLLSGLDGFTVEMNAWHKPLHSNDSPLGWMSIPALPQVSWPFDPQKPFGLASNLQAGDYVIMSGAFVQNSAELHGEEGSKGEDHRGEPAFIDFWKHQCWEDHFRGQGGWLEIHPLDSIRRVSSDQAPMVRKQPQMIQVCDEGNGNTPSSVDVLIPPEPETPPTGQRSDYFQVQFREIVDDRFTDLNTVNPRVVAVDACDPTKLHVQVSVKPQGHFKAVYLVWWEDSQTKRPAPVCPPPHTGPPPPADLPVCNRKPYLPQCKDPSADR